VRKYHWVLWVLLLALALWVFRRFATFQELGAELGRARWGWVLVAAVLHLAYFLPYALLYQYGFAAVGVRSRLPTLIPLVFAAVFANAVLPSGGAAAAALFVDDAERRGQSGARAAVGTVLVLLADLATLVPFLLYGLIALALRHDLKFYDLLGAGIFLLYVTGLTGLIAVSGWKPDWIRRLLGGARRIANRAGSWFQRPDLLKQGWDRKNADQFTDAAHQLVHHRKALAWSLFYGTLVDVISLASLYACFLAFRQPIALGPLVAGFSIGVVFWVIAIIPHGVAAEEGMMMLVFTSLGIPGATAAAVTLAFRLVNYWLPLAIGFFFLRSVRAFGIGPSMGGLRGGGGNSGSRPTPQHRPGQD
jgi:uncharacterized protein (TIRG00374 family)